MPDIHAVLSASGASRWLACTPSAVLESLEPETSTPYSTEGTEAHAEAAEFLQGKKTGKPEHDLEGYVTYVLNRAEFLKSEGKNPSLHIEARLEFDQWVPGGFGTGDVVIIYDGGIEIIDLKYGKGIKVFAPNNPQLRLYGLGAYQTYGALYDDIQEVTTTIVQPRLEHISSDTIKLEDLLDWGETIVKPRAELAAHGEGTRVPGDHCRFCKLAGKCPARAEVAGELRKYQAKPIQELTNLDIAALLPTIDQAEQWIKDVKGYATQELLHGHEIPGYKLVEGRSLRRYTDTLQVAEALKKEGYAEATIYKKELIGITEMEKLLGKKNFTQLLGGLVEKPMGKATLAPDTDKRPAINLSNAESDNMKKALESD